MATILDKTKEADILAAAKLGDADAFGQLYDIYIKQIYNFIFYKTMHQQIAEDISSDVFLKAWKKLDQFKSGSFIAWLYVIARNSVIDHYRQAKETKDIEDCWDLSDNQDLLADTDKSLQIQELKKALSTLKTKDRELLIMRFWQDLSFAEIAERLGKEQGALKMACARAIKQLQSKMPLRSFIVLAGIVNIWKEIN